MILIHLCRYGIHQEIAELYHTAKSTRQTVNYSTVTQWKSVDGTAAAVRIRNTGNREASNSFLDRDTTEPSGGEPRIESQVCNGN